MLQFREFAAVVSAHRLRSELVVRLSLVCFLPGCARSESEDNTATTNHKWESSDLRMYVFNASSSRTFLSSPDPLFTEQNAPDCSSRPPSSKAVLSSIVICTNQANQNTELPSRSVRQLASVHCQASSNMNAPMIPSSNFSALVFLV